MIIDINNCQIGNKAVSSVLLLYYHLILEGGITSDQTVYLDPKDFDGFSFLDVKVDESKYSLEIDQSLLREGAVIYLLCNLNDIISEFDDNFLSHEMTQRIITAHKDGKMSAIPEVENIFYLLEGIESQFNYKSYNKILCEIYEKYVLGTFKKLLE